MKFMNPQIESDKIFHTFRFSAGIEAVLPRCCFCNGTLFAFVIAGVLTSIVLRLNMFGDLLRVNFSLASNRLYDIQKKKEKRRITRIPFMKIDYKTFLVSITLSFRCVVVSSTLHFSYNDIDQFDFGQVMSLQAIVVQNLVPF
jgi:hypothetical protein